MGLSYVGFVGYSLAAQFLETEERVMIGCAGVCAEEKDLEEGMFRVKSVEEAVSILLAQSPEKLRELVKLAFYKPPKITPSCFLSNFIENYIISFGGESKGRNAAIVA
ncbi:unnamed protein product [Ilex paraguariensis]|uniref:Uncharacterized protein n=1 Tax=Ilex paraguariensis TaxID=185542 RepID=A0ABC8URU7_9AQUA